MPLEKSIHGNKTESVMMERGYLKAWQLFKEQTERILPRLQDLVKEDKHSIEGQLHALSALAACRLEQPDLK